jgi:hypothetical protein
MASGTLVGGSLMILGGAAALIGLALAQRSLRLAHRAHAWTARRSDTTVEGWDAWFLTGFSDLTMGIRWLYALVVWSAWTLAGAGLIGLGVYVVERV